MDDLINSDFFHVSRFTLHLELPPPTEHFQINFAFHCPVLIFEKKDMKGWMICLLGMLLSCKAVAQIDTARPPYLRFPTLPPIQLLLGDSTTRYTKANLPRKKPVLLMLFSPDCSHCQHTAEEMLQHREALEDIH